MANKAGLINSLAAINQGSTALIDCIVSLTHSGPGFVAGVHPIVLRRFLIHPSPLL